MIKKNRIIIFTMARHSGMGRFSSEMTSAAMAVNYAEVRLVSPNMEKEPLNVGRTVIPSPLTSGNKSKKILRLVFMNLRAFAAVWRDVRKNDLFFMIDLHATVPLSALPLIAAKLRGAICIINMHDFYPHTLRYPRYLQGIEKLCYRSIYKLFDTVAAMKEAQIIRLVNECSIDRSDIIKIEHGSFPIYGIKYPTLTDKNCIIILGSLRANKCVLETLEAVRDLLREGFDISLKVAGAPRREEPSYWESCLKIVNQIKSEFPNNILVLDRYIEDDELPEILSGVDAVICPYKGFDSQSGISILATSSGIPVIGSSSVTVDGYDITSMITSPINKSNISQAIKRFFSIPRQHRQLNAIHNQQKLEGASTWRTSIGIVLSKYEETLKKASHLEGTDN